METRETSEQLRSFARTILVIGAAGVVLSFIYLASVALLWSAYVHGYPIPSRGFLKTYSAPSNALASAPGVGSIYSRYFDFCARMTSAEYHNQAPN